MNDLRILSNVRFIFKSRKLHYKTVFQGLPISVENRKGSIRRGEDKNGEWQTKMKIPYGYIRGTLGTDGDHLDCFVGPNKESDKVYVIHIKHPDNNKYDEDKVFLGFDTLPDALKTFKEHYDDYKKYLQSYDILDMETFKKRIEKKGKKIEKSHVKSHTKTSKTGKMISVKDYENKKTKSGKPPVIARRLNSFKDLNAPKMDYVDNYGNDRLAFANEVYENKEDYWYKSDESNHYFRWGVELKDGTKMTYHGYIRRYMPEMWVQIQKEAAGNKELTILYSMRRTMNDQEWEKFVSENVPLKQLGMSFEGFSPTDKEQRIIESYVQNTGNILSKASYRSNFNIWGIIDKLYRDISEAKIISEQKSKFDVVAKTNDIKKMKQAFVEMSDNLNEKKQYASMDAKRKFNELIDYAINRFSSLNKSQVIAHQRVSSKGKIVQVRNYQNRKTKKQTPITETPEFKKWFGDSKVVDKNGKPLVVYHGTLYKFKAFRGNNFFFSDDQNFARDYAETKAIDRGIDNSAIVLPVYLKSEKLFNPNNKPDLDNLMSALPDKIHYGFAGKILTKKGFIRRLHGNVSVPPKWKQKQIDNAKFGKVIGEDHFGYNNDLFIGETKDEVIYTTHSRYDVINHITDEQKALLMDGKPVEVNGYRLYNDIYTADQLKQARINGDVSDNEYRRAIFDHVHSTIHSYRASKKVTYLKKQDNWTLFELTKEDIFKIINDLGYDGIKMQENSTCNYAVFSPTQIKSATGNSGEFNPKDPDITKSHVKSHFRATKTGKVVHVSDYDNKIIKLNDANIMDAIQQKGVDYAEIYLKEKPDNDIRDNLRGDGFKYTYLLRSSSSITDRDIKVHKRILYSKHILDLNEISKYHALPITTKLQAHLALKYWNHKYGNKPMELMANGDGYWLGALIRKSSDENYKWQITWFDKKGFSGESYCKTKLEAVDKALTDGYTTFKPGLLTKAASTKDFQHGNEAILKLAKQNELRNKIPVTDTPEFEKWFGNSKVVDKDGKPLVVYHGTNENFKIFDEMMLGRSAHPSAHYGFYFATDIKLANEFADKEGGNIIPVYLKITNPIELEAEDFAEDLDFWRGVEGAKYDKGQYESSRNYFLSMREWGIKNGYDGVYIKSGKTKYPELNYDNWIAFNPNQIKSAIGNRGTFDPKDPDITKSVRFIFKSHVKQHVRASSRGKIVRVKSYDNSVQKNPKWKSKKWRQKYIDDYRTLISRPLLTSGMKERKKRMEEIFKLRTGLNIGKFVQVKEGIYAQQTQKDLPNYLINRGIENYKSLNIKSPEFKAWFGDWENEPDKSSKVIDKTGKPLIVFHGTHYGGFKAFDPNTLLPGLMGKGFYFTENKEVADSYKEKGLDIPLLGTSYDELYNLQDKEVRKTINNIASQCVKENEKKLADVLKMIKESEGLKDYREYYKLGSKYGYGSISPGWLISRRAALKKRIASLKSVPNMSDVELNQYIDSSKYMHKEHMPTDREFYSRLKKNLKPLEPMTYSVYLNIKNPLNMDDPIPESLKQKVLDTPEIKEGLKNFHDEQSKHAPYGFTWNENKYKKLYKDKLLDAKTYLNFYAALKELTAVKMGMFGDSVDKEYLNDVIIKKIVKENGYDGITHIGGIATNSDIKHRVWITLKANQIKAVDNRGTFNNKTIDIYKSQPIGAKMNYRFIFKSHVKQHTRKTKSGKISTVHDYQNRKTKQDDKKTLEYKYQLCYRPFSIGTYPSDKQFGYVRWEDDGSRYGLVVYSKPLPKEEYDSYELSPVTELEKYNKSQIYYFDDYKANVSIDKNNSGRIYVAVEKLDENGEIVDKSYESPTEFLKNIDDGKYKLVEQTKIKKSIRYIIKSFSGSMQQKYPGGKWITITDKSSPMHGRHIFIVPHSDGTATIAWAPGKSGLTHKVLQPKSAKNDEAKKEETDNKKPELSEDERDEAVNRKKEIETAQKQTKEELHSKIREKLGVQTDISKEERDKIEKDISKIADTKERNIERLKQLHKIKSERDKAIDEVISEAKEAMLGSDTTDLPDEKKHLREIIKENAEEFLKFHYQIKAYQREKSAVSKILQNKVKYTGGSDIMEIKPMSNDEILEVLKNEKAVEMEIDDHYRLIINTRGGINKQGEEITGKGTGSTTIARNITKGGFEAMIGITGESSGNSIMDLDTYKTLGSSNAAMLMNYYLENSMGADKYGNEISNLKKYIEKHGQNVAKNGMQNGDKYLDRAQRTKNFGHGEGALFGDRVQANATALQYIQRAYESYGQAEGSLNQAAELLYQFENKKRNMEFSSSSRSRLNSIRDKLKLNKSDVNITMLGEGSYKMTIRPAAFEKMIKERPIVTKQQIGEMTTSDIKAGKANISDYLPEGLNAYLPPDKNGVSQKLVITPHQQSAARLIAKEKRAYLNFEAGTGKSAAYLSAIAEIREQTGKMPKTIISMPKKLMPNFSDEVKKFSDFNVIIVDSSNKNARQKLYNSDPNTIVLVNKEKYLFDNDIIKGAGFDMMIVDEAHKSTQREGRGSSGMSKGLSDLAASMPYFVAGTGSPTPNDLSELYFYLKTIDPEKYGNQKAFMEKYKNLHRGAGMKDKLTEILHREIDDRVFTVRKDLQHTFNQHIHNAGLSDIQKTQYKKTMEDYKAKKFDVLQRDQKLNRVLNSTKFENNEKFTKMGDIINEHIKTKGPDEKVLIYAQQYGTVNEIERYLKKNYPGSGIVRFDGKTKLDDIDKNKTSFRTDKNVRFAIHTDAGTEGLNLQYTGKPGEMGATTAIAMASGANSYSTIDQFFSRSNRTGVPKEMTVDGHLVLTDTPHDIRTETRLEDKKSVMSLVDNAKRTDDQGVLMKSNKIVFVI